jgi:hypothetical protein
VDTATLPAPAKPGRATVKATGVAGNRTGKQTFTVTK